MIITFKIKVLHDYVTKKEKVYTKVHSLDIIKIDNIKHFVYNSIIIKELLNMSIKDIVSNNCLLFIDDEKGFLIKLFDISVFCIVSHNSLNYKFNLTKHGNVMLWDKISTISLN